MKKYYYVFALLTTSYFTSACSPVNSMEPFDDKQAAIVAQSMMSRRELIAYSMKTAHGSTKSSTKYESEQ